MNDKYKMPISSKDPRYGRIRIRMQNGMSFEDAIADIETKEEKSSQGKTQKDNSLEVPVKVRVLADPLNLQVTIDPSSLEAACKQVEDRCRELAAHFEIPKDEAVNPFEALFLIADLQKEMLTELRSIKQLLRDNFEIQDREHIATAEDLAAQIACVKAEMERRKSGGS